MTIACKVVDHTARQGLGLAKHVHTRHLWLKAARDEGRLDVVLTKLLPFDQDSKTFEVSVSQYEVPQNLNEARQLESTPTSPKWAPFGLPCPGKPRP